MKLFLKHLHKEAPLPEFVWTIVGWYGRYLDPVLDEEYISNMEVYSRLTGVNFGKVYIISYLYETGHWCTSLIA